MFACNQEIGGHSWIEVRNRTCSAIYVGDCLVQPNRSVTVGKFGSVSTSSPSEDDHYGIWYNKEHFLQQDEGAFLTNVSVYTEISKQDVICLSAIIADTYGTYSILGDHCGTFAKKVWNEFADTKISKSEPCPMYDEIKQVFGEKCKYNQVFPCNGFYAYYTSDGQYTEIECTCGG